MPVHAKRDKTVSLPDIPDSQRIGDLICIKKSSLRKIHGRFGNRTTIFCNVDGTGRFLQTK